MSKRLLTGYGNKVLNVLWDNGRILECSADNCEGSLLESVYVAKVDNIVKNIQGAFLSAGNLVMYYSLREGKEPFFVKRQRKGELTQGDEIVVQVIREAMKTKDPEASGNIQIAGRYAVITGKRKDTAVFFSKKITDDDWKESKRSELCGYFNSCDSSEIRPEILIRTNAYTVDFQEVFNEIRTLYGRYCSVFETAPYRMPGCCLYESEKPYIRSIRDTYAAGLEEIVSDREDILNEVRDVLTCNNTADGLNFRLYDDKGYPLLKCYSIESCLEKAGQKQVWLQSGAYLIIEQTEALTAIDVNSGKAVSAFGRKTETDEYFYRINCEAAAEVLYQLRLRNISGMIIVDFINLRNEELQKSLLEYMKKEAQKDPVRTTVVDITALGLVEITRKKIREPLDKQLMQ